MDYPHRFRWGLLGLEPQQQRLQPIAERPTGEVIESWLPAYPKGHAKRLFLSSGRYPEDDKLHLPKRRPPSRPPSGPAGPPAPDLHQARRLTSG